MNKIKSSGGGVWNGELLFSGDRVSVWEDENLEMDVRAVWQYEGS